MIYFKWRLIGFLLRKHMISRWTLQTPWSLLCIYFVSVFVMINESSQKTSWSLIDVTEVARLFISPLERTTGGNLPIILVIISWLFLSGPELLCPFALRLSVTWYRMSHRHISLLQSQFYDLPTEIKSQFVLGFTNLESECSIIFFRKLFP